MSQENVELVRRMNAAFNHGDEGWVDFYDPDIEFRTPPEWPEDPVYTGHDGIRYAAGLWAASFSEYEWTIDRLVDASDCVVALHHHRGRIGNSDAWVERPLGAVYFLLDGKIVRVLTFFSWAEAFEAAGLAELEMSEDNVEIARRAMDALNRFDLMVGHTDPLPTLREFCDPDVEWDFSRRRVDPEIYHGYAGWVQIAQQFGDAWQELRMEIEEIIDAGDRVVLFTNMVGLSKSGIELAQRAGQVWTFRDGKIIRDEYFGDDRAACLEAVGLAD